VTYMALGGPSVWHACSRPYVLRWFLSNTDDCNMSAFYRDHQYDVL